MNDFVVGALDACLRFRVPGPEGAWLRELLGDLVVPDPGRELPVIEWEQADAGGWRLQLAGSGAMNDVETAGALAETLVAINSIAATSVVGELAAMHGGTFEVDGVAVAVAGVSGAGKSTTVAAAVLQQHGYLSDEVCAIDIGSWKVRPYHRPIGLRTAGAAAIGVPIPSPVVDYAFVYPWRVSAVGRLAESAPLGLIALVERRPGPVELVELRPADALVRLAALTLGSAGNERLLFRRFEQVARAIRVIELRHDDVFAAVDVLAGAVSR
ncbi:MAG: hypothetical protein AAB131_09570 [Actinomycetota bacterium]|jgi:hypothetical protein|nr:MAG: hypothetical protein FD127_944 [Acidimicrobiaceae bacterium]